MERDAFPVSVSLARYFSDERARCLMSCEPQRRAGWLARRLRRTFALPSRPALTCRGHLLPPGEPLALLQPEDTIEAIPPTARVSDLSRHPPRVGEVARGPQRRHCESPEPSELPGPSEPGSPPSSSPTRASSPPPPPPCLEEMRRRALELLDEHEHEARAPRRRRRVRRRRNAAPSLPSLRPEAEAEADADAVVEMEVKAEANVELQAEVDGEAEMEAEMGVAVEVEAKAGMQAAAEVEGEAATEVLRNEGGRRAARCVRALDAALNKL